MNIEGYSVLKYGTNTKQLDARWNALTESQRYRFTWLGDKFIKEQDLVYATLACELAGINIFYGDKVEIYDEYLRFSGRRESLSYNLGEDYSKWELEREPLEKTIFKYVIREYSPEFIVLQSRMEGNSLQRLYEDTTFSFFRKEILQLIKYDDFVSKSHLSIFSRDTLETAS